MRFGGRRLGLGGVAILLAVVLCALVARDWTVVRTKAKTDLGGLVAGTDPFAQKVANYNRTRYRLRRLATRSLPYNAPGRIRFSGGLAPGLVVRTRGGVWYLHDGRRWRHP